MTYEGISRRGGKGNPKFWRLAEIFAGLGKTCGVGGKSSGSCGEVLEFFP